MYVFKKWQAQMAVIGCHALRPEVATHRDHFVAILLLVAPAKAGAQRLSVAHVAPLHTESRWVPAFAGTTNIPNNQSQSNRAKNRLAHPFQFPSNTGFCFAANA